MLTPHFSKKELACHCGCGACDVDPELLEKLEILRIWFDFPMAVTSGYRCQSYNKRVHGAPNSQHLKGRAVDIRMTDTILRFRLIELAMKAGFRGIGVNKEFIHLDVRQGVHVVFLY